MCNLAANLEAMKVSSVNPWNLKVIEEFNVHSIEETDSVIQDVNDAFYEWRTTSFSERSRLFNAASDVLVKNKNKYAQHITSEMGKPIVESLAEVEKCAWVC